MPTSPAARVMLRMPRTLHGELVALAGDEGVSLNQLVVSTLAGLVAHRAATVGGTGEEGSALGQDLALVSGKLGELSATTSNVAADHDERLSELAHATRDLERRIEQVEAGVDARLRDLEDEWYVARESGFRKGLRTGTLLLDPDEKVRRRRLAGRIGPRFERGSTEP